MSLLASGLWFRPPLVPDLSEACEFGIRSMLGLLSSGAWMYTRSGFLAVRNGSEKGPGHPEEPPLSGESWPKKRSVKAAGLRGLHG